MNTNPYKQNELKALPQNQLEARTLIRAASMLNKLKQNWPEAKKTELIPALEHNRKLWTILASELAEIDHPMDHNLRENLANLAMFIFKHTIKIMADKNPMPKDIEILITINMEVAKGLNENIEPEEDDETEASAENSSPTPNQETESDITEDSSQNTEETDESEEDEGPMSSNFTI